MRRGAAQPWAPREPAGTTPPPKAAGAGGGSRHGPALPTPPRARCPAAVPASGEAHSGAGAKHCPLRSERGRAGQDAAGSSGREDGSGFPAYLSKRTDTRSMATITDSLSGAAGPGSEVLPGLAFSFPETRGGTARRLGGWPGSAEAPEPHGRSASPRRPAPGGSPGLQGCDARAATRQGSLWTALENLGDCGPRPGEQRQETRVGVSPSPVYMQVSIRPRAAMARCGLCTFTLSTLSLTRDSASSRDSCSDSRRRSRPRRTQW